MTKIDIFKNKNSRGVVTSATLTGMLLLTIFALSTVSFFTYLFIKQEGNISDIQLLKYIVSVEFAVVFIAYLWVLHIFHRIEKSNDI